MRSVKHLWQGSRPRVIALLALSVLFGFPTPGLAVEPPNIPGRVMVQFADGTWSGLNVSNTTHFGLRALLLEEDIIAVAPNLIYRQLGYPNPPSDPAYPSQWHLQRNQAARAWQFGDGSGRVVAVIDSGVAPVSDLACLTYTSPKDFRTGLQGIPPDSTGHGTFVTSVVAECTNNRSGASGTAPGTTIMPLGVIDSQGFTTTERLYNALIWARSKGADIVNLSLGFSCSTPYESCRDVAVDSALNGLASAGIAIVAASGNDAGNFLSYPANHPKVIAVGASGYDGAIATYSTKGTGMDLIAPTGDQGDPPDKQGVIHQGLAGLELGAGTSFSAPQVAGALAILLSAGAPSVNSALSALFAGASDIGPLGYDSATGHGDLRIRDALAWGGIGLTPPIRDAGFHAIGDFNGDGKDDAVTYDSRFGRWWVQQSSGNDFSPTEWARFSTTAGWSRRLVGDFSGDGKKDLANFHPSNGTWWVSRSTGARFSTELWADFATPSGWTPQLVGDFNGDGTDDIANYFQGNGTWWVSRSSGSSLSTSLWAAFSTRLGWQDHLVGDFNGDGKDDLAQFHPSNGTWWISRSTGSGFVTSRWADFSTATGWGPQLVGDFDGDGKDDIGNYHSSNGTWWISRSTGSSLTTSLWADFSTSSGWTNQLVGDFDGDGKDDIASHHQAGSWAISRSVGTIFSTSTWFD